MDSKNIAVIGSGSWGIAISNILAENGHIVNVWSFSEDEKNEINNEHKTRFIPDLELNENVTASNDIKEVVEDSEIIFHVTPSKYTRNVFKQYKDYVGDKPIVICSKGFERETLSTLDKVFLDEKPDVRLAAMSGPSFAVEVAKHVPTALILASEDEEILNTVPQIVASNTIRIYKSKDIVGVEFGGSLKNIVAFCAGVCAELDYGTNASSALITRGLAELARLGVKIGADRDTFYGLSGLGDLILTCSSDESRNRRAGRLIGKGYTIEEAREEIGQTIESIDNIEIAKKLAEKYNVDMPIVNAAYDTLFNGLTAKEAAYNLMHRALKFENDFDN